MTLARSAGFAAAALIGLSAARGFCGENFWTGSGPLAGDRVRSLAVDPTEPRTVYASAAFGIFKSVDGGRSWERLSLSGSEGAESLAIHPTAPATLYAAGCGVFKTVNGGLTWSNVSSGLNGVCIEVLAIDPVNPLTLYAGSMGGAYRTTNGGTSWQSIRSGMDLKQVLALAVDPVHPATIYAGTRLEGVFKSTNRGDRWNAASSGLPTIPNPFVPSYLHAPTIEAIAIDPVSPTIVYAGASLPRGLFQTNNGGATWAGTTITQSVSSVVVDPSASATVYAGDPSFGIFRSGDGGTTWYFFSDGLTDRAVTALGIDRTGTFLYAGTASGEVFSYHYASERLHISPPAGRLAPRVVPPRP